MSPVDVSGFLDVLLVSGDLAGGGAQRVVVNLAEALQARGHRVRILTMYGMGEDRYVPPPGVERHDLGLARGESGGAWRAIPKNLARVRRMRAELAALAPAVTVAFLPEINVTTVLASGATGAPVVVTEQVDPRFAELSRPWRALRRATYGRARALVSASHGIDRQFDWFRRRDRFVVPNLLVRETCPPAPRPESLGETIVGMGRLTSQKGFDLLLRAFGTAREVAPTWRLVVYGEGEERTRLETLASELGLAGSVSFPGWAPDPEAQLARADVFVLPSRFEGFGNVLVEAMAVGTPVVAFDCPSGPSDIVQAEVNGLLVPAGDVNALAKALARVMTEPALRLRLAARASAELERFTFQTVSRRWETILRDVARG